MLSDALHEAGEIIDRYITDDHWRQHYDTKLLADIEALRLRMREIGRCLDHPPWQTCGYCAKNNDRAFMS